MRLHAREELERGRDRLDQSDAGTTREGSARSQQPGACCCTDRRRPSRGPEELSTRPPMGVRVTLSRAMSRPRWNLRTTRHKPLWSHPQPPLRNEADDAPISRACQSISARAVAASETTQKRKFTEPVALLSTRPVDLPLPRTASGLSFDLLALRARCDEEPTGGDALGQARPRWKWCSLRPSSSCPAPATSGRQNPGHDRS